MEFSHFDEDGGTDSYVPSAESYAQSIWTFPCKDIWMNMYIYPAARETAPSASAAGICTK